MALERFCECVGRGEIDRAGQSGNRGPTPKLVWRELDATRALAAPGLKSAASAPVAPESGAPGDFAPYRLTGWLLYPSLQMHHGAPSGFTFEPPLRAKDSHVGWSRRCHDTAWRECLAASMLGSGGHAHDSDMRLSTCPANALS